MSRQADVSPRATEPTIGRRGMLLAIWTVVGLHVVAGILLVVVLGETSTTATVSFGGLAATAYTLGVRHAFDADHIAAIDNTTRSLVAQRRPATTVGMWFSLGHSTIVIALAVLVAIGASVVGTLIADGSAAQHALGLVGALVSGVFLVVIGIINLVGFTQTAKLWRRARGGDVTAADLSRLTLGGPFARLLRPMLAAVQRPSRMYVVGLLFGLGFDTATETALLILAGTSAAIGMSWYAILLLPLLFAAGMCLFDTADGVLMQRAYRWALLQPARKLAYNLTVTGLSVIVALGIGGIGLIGVLHDEAGLTDPVTGWIAGLGLAEAGYYIVGVFAVIWLAALAGHRIRNRRQARPA